MVAAATPHIDLDSQRTERKLTRLEMVEPETVGERIADKAAALVGSWRFIIIQTVLVVCG